MGVLGLSQHKERELKNYIFIVLALTLFGCAATEVMEVDDSKGVKDNIEEEAPVSKRIYYFQHKVISKWLFDSDGAFFFDMVNGSAGQFIEAASEIVNAEYANGIIIRPIPSRDAVLIKFPEPKSVPNCYYSILAKSGDTFSYHTYEKAMSFGGEDFVGVVGGWDSEGNHSNFGPRDYLSDDQFIMDILNAE